MNKLKHSYTMSIFTNNKGLIFKNQMNFFSCRHFKSKSSSRSPRQQRMENRMRRLKKFKFVSNENITNETLFLLNFHIKKWYLIC